MGESFRISVHGKGFLQDLALACERGSGPHRRLAVQSLPMIALVTRMMPAIPSCAGVQVGGAL